MAKRALMFKVERKWPYKLLFITPHSVDVEQREREDWKLIIDERTLPKLDRDGRLE
jgi:hypothetical protein